MLMQGIATIESMGHVAVAKAVGVATTPPRVVAQAFHGAAADGGRQVALVVFQGIVHGACSVALCGKKLKFWIIKS